MSDLKLNAALGYLLFSATTYKKNMSGYIRKRLTERHIPYKIVEGKSAEFKECNFIVPLSYESAVSALAAVADQRYYLRLMPHTLIGMRKAYKVYLCGNVNEHFMGFMRKIPACTQEPTKDYTYDNATDSYYTITASDTGEIGA
jgi:hypothetical protein